MPTLLLAGPIVLAELGWVTMGIADTMFVGHLGPEALGAVGIGGTLFLAVAVFGMGMLNSLDTLVSQAFGAAVGRIRGVIHHPRPGCQCGLRQAPLRSMARL